MTNSALSVVEHRVLAILRFVVAAVAVWTVIASVGGRLQRCGVANFELVQ